MNADSLENWVFFWCMYVWCCRGQEVAQPFDTPFKRCGGPADVHVCTRFGNAQHTHTHTHTRINPNIRWNSLNDHSFFFPYPFHYVFRGTILLFRLADAASFPLLHIQKVALYIMPSERDFCSFRHSRTKCHNQHCSFCKPARPGFAFAFLCVRNSC